MERLDNRQVEAVEINGNHIYFVTDEESHNNYRTIRVDDDQLLDRLIEAKVTFGEAAPNTISPWISIILGYIIPIAFVMMLGRIVRKNLSGGMSDEFSMTSLQISKDVYLGDDNTLTCAPETAKKTDDLTER